MTTNLFIQVTIFFFYLGAGESKVIHVVPSLNAPCLKPSCLTLSQLTTNTSYFDNTGTKLIVLEGNHTLDSKFAVSNVSELALTCGSSTLQTNIICYHNASFSFSRMDSLQVKGLIFIGCGNNMIMSVNRLLVEDSSFIGQKGTGTALKINETNATIVSSFFSANMLGSRCLIPVEDHLSYYPIVGGVILAYLSDIVIINSSVTGNRADLGGAVFGYYSNISIISSNFTDNQVTPYNSIFVHSHCFKSSQSSMLSQIDIDTEEATKRNSNLQKISCKETFYLASVIAIFHSTVFINGSLFSNNTSICGGAMSVFQYSTARICNSKLTNNSATQFGGMLMVGLADVVIYNCLFHNSYAKQGGVFKVGNSSVNIT